MKSFHLVSSAAVFLCAASVATASTTRPAFVVRTPNTIRQRVQPQNQALFLSSFPADSILPEPERFSSSNIQQEAPLPQQQQQQQQQQPVESIPETPSLSPLVAMSVGTVMMLVGFATTTAVAPTPVVQKDPIALTAEKERRVQQDRIDYELQEQMMAADVASGGFYY